MSPTNNDKSTPSRQPDDQAKRSAATSVVSPVVPPVVPPVVQGRSKAKMARSLRAEKRIQRQANPATDNILVKQIRSTIRRPDKQRRQLAGLGLHRIGQQRSLKDTPAIRGMIAKVKHLVEVTEPDKK